MENQLFTPPIIDDTTGIYPDEGIYQNALSMDTSNLAVNGGSYYPQDLQAYQVVPSLAAGPVIKGYSTNLALANTAITILGTGFTTVSKVVFFGGDPVSGTLIDSTKIMAVIPANGFTGIVTVNFANGKTAVGPALQILGQTAPGIFDATPNPVFNTNSTVGIFGGLLPVGATAFVQFGGNVSSSARVPSSNFFSTALPMGAQTGKLTIRFGPAGSRTFNGPLLRIFSPFRSVTGYNPNPAKRGALLTITGGGFSQLMRVGFAGILGPIIAEGFTRDSFFPDNQISVQVPAGAFSGGVVRLFFADGTFMDGPPLIIN